MLIEVIGLAFIAALSPTALLVTAVYLGSARPKMVAGFYLLGALVMSLVMGIVLVVVLRNLDLSHPDHRTPRYALRLGIGVAMVIAAVVMAKRTPRSAASPEKSGLVSRMVADPAPLSALLVGLLVFAPGATFLATVQVIATSRADIELTAIALIIVVVENALLVWLPIALYIVMPDRTSRSLTRFNVWLRANSQTILAWTLTVFGALLMVDGIYGLATG